MERFDQFYNTSSVSEEDLIKQVSKPETVTNLQAIIIPEEDKAAFKVFFS
jgi:hypothetical protein